jgi:hypothetical protein
MKTEKQNIIVIQSAETSELEEEWLNINWYKESIRNSTGITDMEVMMQFKTGTGWKACSDEERGFYSAEYGGGQNYDLYEITKEIYDQLDETMTEGDASSLISEGRHLYMSVNDRCGPPYTVEFDHDYRKNEEIVCIRNSCRLEPFGCLRRSE